MTKPKLLFALLCDQIIEEKSGNLSIIGVFDNIDSPGYPAIHPRICVFTRWADVEGENTVGFKLLDPEKKNRLAQSGPLKLIYKEGARFYNVYWNLFGFRFEAPGEHWIEVLLDDEHIHYELLNVRKV
jgi:hypothetical protein